MRPGAVEEVVVVVSVAMAVVVRVLLVLVGVAAWGAWSLLLGRVARRVDAARARFRALGRVEDGVRAIARSPRELEHATAVEAYDCLGRAATGARGNATAFARHHVGGRAFVVAAVRARASRSRAVLVEGQLLV